MICRKRDLEGILLVHQKSGRNLDLCSQVSVRTRLKTFDRAVFHDFASVRCTDLVRKVFDLYVIWIYRDRQFLRRIQRCHAVPDKICLHCLFVTIHAVCQRISKLYHYLR